MREIRSLPVATSSQPTEKPKVGWSALQGLMFVSGILLIIVGVVFAGYSRYVITRLNVKDTIADRIEAMRESVDDQDLAANLEEWRYNRDMGLSQDGTPEFMMDLKIQAWFQRTEMTGWSLIGIGLLLIVGSIVTRRRS